MNSISYPYRNFYAMLRDGARTHARKTAVFVDREKIGYAALLAKADAFARFMELRGIGRGDRVALIAPNGPEFIVAVFAAAKLGAVTVPVNHMLKAAEFVFILDDAAVKLLVTSEAFAGEVEGLYEKVATLETVVWVDRAPSADAHNIVFGEVGDLHPDAQEKAADVGPDDPAVIFYTSGTTGNPKGALMSYRNLFSNMSAGEKVFGVGPSDRFIVYLPMFHSFTFTIMVLMPFYTKSSVVVVHKLMPFSNIIKQTLLRRVTVFLGIPDIYNALIRAKLPWYFMWFNRIRLFISGASALSEETLTRFSQRFKRANMMEGYGLSENSPAAAVNPFGRAKPGSVGKALPGYEIKIVDDEMVEVPCGQVGEIIIKGEGVMLGYLNRPEATEETVVNGWLRTGDLGRMDEEEYLFIVDRKKDLIISKGINIYPRQIEEELVKLPAIASAAVIGVSDPKNGEVPVAYVELEADWESPVHERDIKAALKENLANFKIPRNVYIVDALPKTATGKVLKRLLKAQLNAQK